MSLINCDVFVCVCLLTIPFTSNILRCLQALCLHFAFFQALLFKNQSPANDRPQETVGRITLPPLPPSLSPSRSPLSLSFPPCQKGLSLYSSLLLLPLLASPPPLLPQPWLERVASECQMYYRVSHGNVNTQACHESRVVWPPSFPPLSPTPSPPSSPFLSSLPRSADCQRGGESAKQQRESVCVFVGVGRSKGRSRSIVAVVCLCFGCSAYRTPGERLGCGLMFLRLQSREFFMQTCHKPLQIVRVNGIFLAHL